jgi:hypothetical protein
MDAAALYRRFAEPTLVVARYYGFFSLGFFSLYDEAKPMRVHRCAT